MHFIKGGIIIAR